MIGAAAITFIGETWRMGGLLYEVTEFVFKEAPMPHMHHQWGASDDEAEMVEYIHLRRCGGGTDVVMITVEQARGYMVRGTAGPVSTIPRNLECWSEAEQDYYRTA